MIYNIFRRVERSNNIIAINFYSRYSEPKARAPNMARKKVYLTREKLTKNNEFTNKFHFTFVTRIIILINMNKSIAIFKKISYFLINAL